MKLKGLGEMEHKSHTADFKVKAVLENLQRDTTLEGSVAKNFELRKWSG